MKMSRGSKPPKLQQRPSLQSLQPLVHPSDKMMEREELIWAPAAPAAPDAAAPAASGTGGSAARRKPYRSEREAAAARKRTCTSSPGTLCYAHCASSQQIALLHMTIAKGAADYGMERKKAMRVAAAEFVATALLVGVGCAGCTTALSHDSVQLSLSSSLGFGLTVGMLVQIFGHVSGAHMNPAVTVCALILEVIRPKMLFVYVAAQVAGATAGFGILRMVTPLSILKEDSHQENGFCTTVPNAELSVLDAFASEFLATTMLILLVCSSWDARNPNCQNLPTQFALAITALGVIFGTRTGASMNPARSFGPAVWNSVWTTHWLYWLAPILAAVLTTIMYRGLFGFKQLGGGEGDADDEGDNELEDLGPAAGP